MANLSGRRILVVEHEASAALMSEKLLRELGCLVPGRAGRDADAIAIIETEESAPSIADQIYSSPI